MALWALWESSHQASFVLSLWLRITFSCLILPFEFGSFSDQEFGLYEQERRLKRACNENMLLIKGRIEAWVLLKGFACRVDYRVWISNKHGEKFRFDKLELRYGSITSDKLVLKQSFPYLRHFVSYKKFTFCSWEPDSPRCKILVSRRRK